jgi:hypothetical protein
MKALRKIVVVALVLASAALAPTARAAGAAEFDCYGSFPVWGSGSYVGGGSCSGGATGVFHSGPLLCAFCEFEMTVDHYQTTCIANEPPLVAAWEGRINVRNTVGNGFSADYQAVLGYGAFVAITSSSPLGAGIAVMRPAIPLPTCANPFTLDYQLVGGLTFS